jgi:hypothetical protein
MRHVAIPVDDLLVGIALGGMSLLVPIHEVLEVGLALSAAQQLIQQAHIPSSFITARRNA